MKNSRAVIQNIQGKPNFQRLKEQEYFNRLVDVLPLALRNGIKFLYKKDTTLYFVVMHNLFLTEIKYKIKELKKLIKELEKIERIDLNVKDIKAFVTRKAPLKEERKDKSTAISYKEISDGDFNNLAENEDIKLIFEEIREVIKSNKK